ncbi:YqkE family protein [Aquibacillus koreensis]|uniref:YqkE family protein n=1 Tax=Aquibacillus koreensis TaxID=279446 RepID=A0A9X3WK70_9BACI|nr:YqkE family protein [Aquibacillus koreensis]MCT2537458.1 YqkE family protein [Aquibacillus koreensis]MDC3418904.1 YqkE family protein [Aquibacillus koreensis]
MSKRKKVKDENSNALRDRLDLNLVSQLTEKKEKLKKQIEEDQERERKQKIEERKQKEANKSFEELLAESELDWKKYK